MELAKAGALVVKAVDSEVMGEPGGTPCPLLMALASAACPGLSASHHSSCKPQMWGFRQHAYFNQHTKM